MAKDLYYHGDNLLYRNGTLIGIATNENEAKRIVALLEEKLQETPKPEQEDLFNKEQQPKGS